jgi:hypothetical protein
MISSLKSGAATEPDQRYLDYTMLVQHADFGPIPEGAADLVEEIIGAPTLLDPRITDGTWKLVNVTPAWGDVWFWRALHEKYPPIENALADFLLNLAQANPEGMSVNTRYDRCIIFPREVLKFMFNPAYEHLTRFFPGLRTNAKGTEGFEKALQIIH